MADDSTMGNKLGSGRFLLPLVLALIAMFAPFASGAAAAHGTEHGPYAAEASGQVDDPSNRRDALCTVLLCHAASGVLPADRPLLARMRSVFLVPTLSLTFAEASLASPFRPPIA
jgi:hypothetical protein